MSEHASPLGIILARVLDAHEYQTVTRPLRPACRCGWAAGAEWSAVTVYDAHVVAEFERAVAEDEGLAEVIGPVLADLDNSLNVWSCLDQIEQTWWRNDARAVIAALTNREDQP